MANVRKIVVDALVKIERTQGYSNLMLDSILKSVELPEQDRGFASRLLYGIIERKLTLDFYIAKLTSKPLKKLSPLVLNCLRIGIYQLEYMDKIPANAAVNESVAIVKASKERYASGFVNAVLRGFIRNKPILPNDSSFYALSVRYSCPTWFIEELSNYLGKEQTISFLDDSLQLAPVFARVNNTLITTETLLNSFNSTGVEATEVSDDCIRLHKIGAIERVESFKLGYFHVQDLSSQLCVKALDPQPNDRVLDVCSAPGGKSCTAAELMNNCGEIVSCDLYDQRTRLVKSNSERLKLDIIKPMVNDATVYNEKLGKFNKILCDVPCSGFGVIRRKPEIKYKLNSDLTNLPQLQYNILDTVSKYLESGGLLVYSTCTLRKDENEAVVKRFLETHSDFSVCESYPDFFNGYGHILTPLNSGGDGFFFSVLKRK